MKWFSDNNPTGLSILTTILANTSIVGYLTIEENKQTFIHNIKPSLGPLINISLIKSPFPFSYQYLLNKYLPLSFWPFRYLENISLSRLLLFSILRKYPLFIIGNIPITYLFHDHSFISILRKYLLLYFQIPLIWVKTNVV